MNENYTKIEKISNEGFDLEFGPILEKAFSNFKMIAGIGGISMILISIVLAIVFGGAFAAIYGFSDFTGTLTGLNPEFMTGSSLITFFVSSVVMAGIFNPISAGFIKMAYAADKNESFGLDTIFTYYKGSFFKELFLSGIIIGFFSAGITYLLQYFGLIILGNLVTYIVTFFTFLTIPLIIFSNLTAFQAITISVKLVLKQPIIILGLLIISILIVILGILGFCIGIFFTTPFLYSMYYCIYTAIIPIKVKSELDEIGQNEE